MTAALQKLAAELARIADAERREIDEAANKIRARTNTLRERMVARLGPDLPALSWTWTRDEQTSAVQARGQASAGYYESEVPGIVKAWADALGLEIQQGGLIASLGGLSAEGETAGVRVTVWGVVDRARWEEELRPHAAPVDDESR